MNLGAYTGNKEKALSYLYGKHWENKIGFKVVPKEGDYNHRFGGQDWCISTCENCKQPLHQIFTFDLTDPKLKLLSIVEGHELPLVSCLNCSASWGRQVFKFDFKQKIVTAIYTEDEEHWIQDEDYKIDVPLPRYKVGLQELEQRDNPIDEESYYRITESLGEESLCRVLGAPVFLQSPIDLDCPICHSEMIYVATIFSQPYGGVNIFPDIDFFLGEMTLYYHICPNCKSMKVECQGT